MSANRKALRDCVVLLAIMMMIFTAWPSLDIWASSLFFSSSDGFWLARLHWIDVLRETIWLLIILGFVGALGMLVFTKVFRSTAPVLDKVWEVIVLTYLAGPIILVDAILKRYWGRARPSTVEEFGGPLDFTPAFMISDQCPKNCSFVSGEGSGVTALLIAVLLVTRNMVPSKYSRLITIGAFAVAATGLSLRIVMGRHFLSDTVFAVLFVTLIALGLLQLKRYKNLRLF